MDNFADFNQFQTQSKKGILVIFMHQLMQVFKATWILLIVFIQKFSKFSDPALGYVYLSFFIAIVILISYSLLIFKNFQFKIENNHFVLKKGIFKKSLISIPFDRIQNINFKQNIVQQIINTYEVEIETAGSAKAEISIKAMSLSQANLLKKALTNFSKSTNENQSEILNIPFLKVNFSQLIKESLTENHFQSLFLTVAFAIGIYQQVRDVFKNFKNQELFDNFVSENTSAIQTSIILILIFFILIVFVALISSFVRVLITHFDQSVYIKNETLEISQGLTTKKMVVLKKNKIQFITVSFNPLKKWLNSYFVRFSQATSGIEEGKKNKIIKIIGCKKTHISAIKQLLFEDENTAAFQQNRSDKFYKNRLYLRAVFMLILINSFCYFIFENKSVFLINILLIPLAFFLIHLKFTKRTYVFSIDLLEITTGMIETHSILLPFYKIQNIKLKQTYFQERKNVADLVFQTASGKVKIPCIQIDLAKKLYDYTIFKIETSQHSWM
ncbi:PH domain-containing protein [Polaribacter sp.]|uniref:PH domain-containing protein n=1 Tax=Polaribacter sp. TaxID=1920175 RepID=UPI004048BE26